MDTAAWSGLLRRPDLCSGTLRCCPVIAMFCRSCIFWRGPCLESGVHHVSDNTVGRCKFIQLANILQLLQAYWCAEHTH